MTARILISVIFINGLFNIYSDYMKYKPLCHFYLLSLTRSMSSCLIILFVFYIANMETKIKCSFCDSTFIKKNVYKKSAKFVYFN